MTQHAKQAWRLHQSNAWPHTASGAVTFNSLLQYSARMVAHHAAEVVHYLETAYGVMVDSPEDRESLAGQNSDLELGTDAAQSLLEPLAVTDTPHSPSRYAGWGKTSNWYRLSAVAVNVNYSITSKYPQ